MISEVDAIAASWLNPFSECGKLFCPFPYPLGIYIFRNILESREFTRVGVIRARRENLLTELRNDCQNTGNE